MTEEIRQQVAESEVVEAIGCGPALSIPRAASHTMREQVFEHVRAAGQAARADVTRALDISPGSVTSITADLIGAGLLRETTGAARDTGRGRPPVALEVVPESHYVVGIKLEERGVSGVLCDFAGRRVAAQVLPMASGKKSITTILQQCDLLITDLAMQSGLDRNLIAGAGIGLPGTVEATDGSVAWSPLLKETELALGQYASQKLGLPCCVDNDTNVLTAAELWFGDARDMSNFAVVTIEQGVGMGLVQGNRLFRGLRGMGLELGHTKVQLDGALCRCGQRGCLEAYVSDYALVREATTALDTRPSGALTTRALMDALVAEARAGNVAAETIFHRAGRYLSLGLSNVVQLFDPDLIILAGARMQYDFLYAQDVLSEMRMITQSLARTPTRVEVRRWDSSVWAQGAAALALEALTARVLVQEWVA